MTINEKLIEAAAWDVCRDVAELPDRTSPETHPEWMMVTQEELAAIVQSHIRAIAPMLFASGAHLK